MIVMVGAITGLASEGYLTLQVQECCIGGTPNTLTLPDSWFCYIRADKSPCIGRQTGFLYLTEKGYLANKNHIKAAFLKALASGIARRGATSWQDFENHAAWHFSEVRSQLSKLVNKHTKTIAQLNSFTI